jgi:ribonucleoside-diphosphate reductase alpha chain
MQAACQEFVDASISKTINCPSDMPYDKFKAVYSKAYEIGLKGCTTYRPSGVRGAVLTTESQNKPNIPVIVARPQKLIGATYKVRWPKIDSAFYVTINDHIGEDGIRRPFEIFINSKSVQHTEWIAALTRCISAIFRRGLDGGDITFIVDELIQVFSATGGAFMNGGYVPSLVALIGQTIGEHMKEIGLIARTPTQYPEGSADGSRPSITAMGDICPLCNQPTLFKQEGCEKCSCGYSSCG